MFTQPAWCPNPDCVHHDSGAKGFYKKNGTYRTKHDRQRVPRYLCRGCGRSFNSRSFLSTAGQHKPEVNKPLMGLLCSGVTMRRAARLLGLARRTVEQRVRWMAGQARKAHAEFLAASPVLTSYVQFDEMETYEGSRLRQLSIALAVRPKTGQILAAEVGTMNCHGVMAKVSRAIYGHRRDTRMAACRRALANVRMVAKKSITLATDGKDSYRPPVREVLPNAVHSVHNNVRVPKMEKPLAPPRWDPLFRLNQMIAKLRADLARLGRQTWSASKTASGLADHLAIYIAFNNGYKIV